MGNEEASVVPERKVGNEEASVVPERKVGNEEASVVPERSVASNTTRRNFNQPMGEQAEYKRMEKMCKTDSDIDDTK